MVNPKERLIEKIKGLPPDRMSEVEDFVDFIAQRSATVSRHETIAAYAARYAGTVTDLDPQLEGAASEHLRDEEQVSR